MRGIRVMAAGGFLMINSIFGAQAGSSLISDFETESTAVPAPLGGQWYFYDDVSNGGNSLVTTASHMTDSTAVPVRSDYFFDSSSYAGGNASARSLKFGFTLGTKKPSCGTNCTYNPGVGMGVNIALDITGATGISFWAKADAPAKLALGVGTSDIKDNGNYAKVIPVTTAWAKYTVTFSELTQPSWAAKFPFAAAKFTSIGWGVSKDDNAAMTTDAVYLDNVVIEGWTAPVEPDGIAAKAVRGISRYQRDGRGITVVFGATESSLAGVLEAVDGSGRAHARVSFAQGAREAFLPLDAGSASVPLFPSISRP